MENDTKLREMIRMIPPARSLKEDIDKSIHLDTYEGTGDAAIRTFSGLQKSVAKIADDPYLDSLSVEVDSEATDREKVSVVGLVAGQLLAYLEGQTGLPGAGSGGKGGFYVNSAPQIALNNVKGLSDKVLSDLVEVVKKDQD